MALLDDLFEGEVSASMRKDLEEHLSGCEHCFVTMNTTRRTIELYADHELYPLPEDMRERLHTAIIAKCKGCSHS